MTAARGGHSAVRIAIKWRAPNQPKLTPVDARSSLFQISGIVPGGPPMRLSAIGTVQRRSLVLILRDSTKPWAMLATDWTPKGLCNR